MLEVEGALDYQAFDLWLTLGSGATPNITIQVSLVTIPAAGNLGGT